jgi:hypothetical protein
LDYRFARMQPAAHGLPEGRKGRGVQVLSDLSAHMTELYSMPITGCDNSKGYFIEPTIIETTNSKFATM